MNTFLLMCLYFVIYIMYKYPLHPQALPRNPPVRRILLRVHFTISAILSLRSLRFIFNIRHQKIQIGSQNYKT